MMKARCLEVGGKIFIRFNKYSRQIQNTNINVNDLSFKWVDVVQVEDVYLLDDVVSNCLRRGLLLVRNMLLIAFSCHRDLDGYNHWDCEDSIPNF